MKSDIDVTTNSLHRSAHETTRDSRKVLEESLSGLAQVSSDAISEGAAVRAGRRLRSSVVRIEKLSMADQASLLRLMNQAYDNVSEEQFIQSLAQKTHVILVRSPEDQVIRGFMAMAAVEVWVGDGMVRGFYSGETVLEKAYWGERSLGAACLRFLASQKMRKPREALYWLQSPNGYKSYLMMANNLDEHWPRYESETPFSRKALQDAFFCTMFPKAYNPRTGLIEFRETSVRLKESVAPVDLLLERNNKRVGFFVARNPRWAQGSELACIAQITWSVALRYRLKSIRRRLFGRSGGRA